MPEIEIHSPAKKAKLNITSEIKKKSEKAENDPEVHTNWCDLPLEMREMCIRKMDVQSKFQMRNTAKIERKLVDLEKLHFKRVEFHIYYNIEVLFWKNCSPTQEAPDYHFRAERNTKEYKNVLLESALLMKMSTIENLRMCYDDNYSEAPVEFRRLAPFKIKNLYFNCTRDSDVWKPESFFLNNSELKIEEFQLERTQFHTFKFEDLLYVKTPKLAKIRFYELPYSIIDYIKKWIHDDVEIGTELLCEVLREKELNWLTKAFRSRKISSKRQIHRFRTDNPTKELILSIGTFLDKDRLEIISATWRMVSAVPKRTNPMRAVKRRSFG